MTIDGVTSFLQLLDIQNVHKNMCFSLGKSCGKFCQSAEDGEIVIDNDVPSFIFFIFLCVRIEINSHWQLFVAEYITVCRSVVSG